VISLSFPTSWNEIPSPPRPCDAAGHSRQKACQQGPPYSSLESQQPISLDKYPKRLAEVGIKPSFGSIGDSCDNELAETIDGLYQAEVILKRGPWRSFADVEVATQEWVDWFNRRRMLEPIGNIQPAKAEENYYAAAMDDFPMAAQHRPTSFRKLWCGSIALGWV
jgi:putative transposase